MPTPLREEAEPAPMSAEASHYLPMSDERRYLLGMQAVGASASFVFSNDPQGSLKKRNVEQFAQFVTPEDVLSLIAENAAFKKSAEKFGSDFRARRAEWRQEQTKAADEIDNLRRALSLEKQRAADERALFLASLKEAYGQGEWFNIYVMIEEISA